MTPDLSANEKNFLGCLLRSPHEFWEARNIVRAEMITSPEWRAIYAALSDLQERGRVVSRTALASVLPEEFDDGRPYVAEIEVLIANAADAGSALDYAEAIRNAFTRRRIRRLGEAALKAEADQTKSGDDIVAEIEAQLLHIVSDNAAENIKWLGDAARESLAKTAENYRVRDEIQIGLTTGIAEIDSLTGPLMGGDLVTIAAPSGHGKTTIATQILCHASRKGAGKPAFLVSLEMTASQIARRVMASWTRVSVRKQRAGDLDVFEYETLREAVQRADAHHVLMDESGRQSAARICKKIRAMHSMHGIGCAAIDHILLVKPANPRWTKVETAEDAIMAFKDLAKELDIPIFALAQLTRGSQDKAHTWRFTDQALYGGDAIKQASDIMLGVTLPRKWLRQREPEEGTKDHDLWVGKMERWKGRAEVGSLKMRDGDDGHWFALDFDGATYSFGSRAA
jgi:replicative DNA helicase